MDYLDHFGLTAEPFSNAPVSEFYFASGQHTGALERLHFVVERSRGLAILIGEIGLGKTTLARRLLESLPEDQYEAALLVIVHTGITANWLLKRIAMQLGVEDPGEDKVSILSRLFARLVEINEEGRRAVVLIDEAQMLGTRELMEEFRGLLNMEQADGKLLNFVLFGLPEIEENLRLDPPLAQRISKRLRLSALSREDSFAYVKHRMNVAGGKSDFFNEASLAAIFSFSRGVPRLINTLCDNILLELFFAREHEVSAEFVAEVAIDLGLSGQSGEELTHAKSAVDIQDFEPEQLATDDSEGSDAIVDAHFDPASEMVAQEVPGDETPTLDAAEIARQVAQEGTEEPLSDPYETETLPEDSADDVLVVEPMGAFAEEAFPAQPAQAEPFESMAADPLDEDEEDDGPVSSWAVPLPEHEETESWVVPSPVSGANDVAADEISVDEFDVDADEISVDEFDVDADEVSVEEFDVDADEISVDEFDVDTDEVSVDEFDVAADEVSADEVAVAFIEDDVSADEVAVAFIEDDVSVDEVEDAVMADEIFVEDDVLDEKVEDAVVADEIFVEDDIPVEETAAALMPDSDVLPSGPTIRIPPAGSADFGTQLEAATAALDSTAKITSPPPEGSSKDSVKVEAPKKAKSIDLADIDALLADISNL